MVATRVMVATTIPLLSELRALPSDRLEQAAAFIEALLEERRTKRNAMIDSTAGSLEGPVGDALENALSE